MSQCKGITKAGAQCKRRGWDSNGLCTLHEDQGAPELRAFTPEWWAYHRATRVRHSGDGNRAALGPVADA